MFVLAAVTIGGVVGLVLARVLEKHPEIPVAAREEPVHFSIEQLEDRFEPYGKHAAA
jgi:hypothetical protein